MTTRLDRPLKRELEIDGTVYTLTVTPDGMSLVLKGKRKGFQVEWRALVSGEAALATALNASLTATIAAPAPAARVPKPAAPAAQAPPAPTKRVQSRREPRKR